MNKREKSWIGIAAAVAVVLVVVNGFPTIYQIYEDGQSDNERMELDLAREANIIFATGDWRDRRIQTEAKLEGLQNDIFQAETLSLVSANIQRDLRRYASEAGISVTSTKLAENRETKGWLMVEQEMSFRMTDESSSMQFLELLEQSTPHLEVTAFSMRRNRSQITGSVTVVAFSRPDGLQQASNSSR